MSVIIGITPDTHDGSELKTRTRDEQYVLLWDSYLKAVLDHAAVPVILPVTSDKKRIKVMLERVDGLVLAGGNFDVPPAFYGEEQKPWLETVKPARSRFELYILQAAMRRDVPVLGICGGEQIINVAFGGTLYQDILKERPASNEHEHGERKTGTAHQVEVEAGTLLHRITSGGRKKSFTFGVNSTHHQAVKEVGKGLCAGAHATDGIIEAVESERHSFVLGVQWHPELLYSARPDQAAIFKSLIRAARSRNRKR
ncbi:MAG: gamma-glutamyl-gamma-aminobutyrate hydrolase family protein [bacterium]